MKKAIILASLAIVIVGGSVFSFLYYLEYSYMTSREVVTERCTKNYERIKTFYEDLLDASKTNETLQISVNNFVDKREHLIEKDGKIEFWSEEEEFNWCYEENTRVINDFEGPKYGKHALFLLKEKFSKPEFFSPKYIFVPYTKIIENRSREINGLPLID